MENTVNLKSSIAWSDFKLNSDGMVPVIAQDYQTNEVLMLAYMNEEAFNTTLETGKMTYWSRSRNELWTKGLTSGHLQFVKSLTLDCDNDTILAKVDQVGAACHTGNRTCFFKPLMKKEYDDTNPLHVFQNVYDVITDRKANPKEGSYTNYLFDKGIDKILKKVGEECTEIVIAAKNAEALRILNDKIKDREIEKLYLCAVQGRPKPAQGRLENYLFKDAQKNQVYVKTRPEPGAKTAVTEYRTIATKGALSLVECRLLTGRTHQIRAQMAHFGCPLLGDGKYGSERFNKGYGEKGQALYSYKLRFEFPTDAGCLEYLRGREFCVRSVDFAEKYFGISELGSL